MKKIYAYFGLLLVNLALSGGCRPASKSGTEIITDTAQTLPENQVEEQPAPNRNAPHIPPKAAAGLTQIPTGYGRIQAKLIAILPGLEKDKTTPCGKAPCKAKIKIQRVLGYGSGFGMPLGEGQELTVYFPLTLKPTENLPGLKTGNIFQADIKAAGENSRNYTVNTYQLVKPDK